MCSAKAAFFVVESHLNTAYPQMDPLDRRRLALQWVDAAPLVTAAMDFPLAETSLSMVTVMVPFETAFSTPSRRKGC